MTQGEVTQCPAIVDPKQDLKGGSAQQCDHTRKGAGVVATRADEAGTVGSKSTEHSCAGGVVHDRRDTDGHSRDRRLDSERLSHFQPGPARRAASGRSWHPARHATRLQNA